MASRFYRVVDSDELAGITKARAIRRNVKQWHPYKANEAVFVLSEKATISDLRALVERQRAEGRHTHIVEIEVIGRVPWMIEDDRSFQGFQGAFAILADVEESETVRIRNVATFAWQQTITP